MTLILLPAALAALWCFRSARTVALFGIAALILWACLSSSHAQMTAIVRCQMGKAVFVLDADVCEVATAFYRKNYPLPTNTSPAPITRCANTIARDLGVRDIFSGRFLELCRAMWAENV